MAILRAPSDAAMALTVRTNSRPRRSNSLRNCSARASARCLSERSKARRVLPSTSRSTTATEATRQVQIICLIAQRAPQQDLDAVQKWAAAASVVVSLIHGKPSRLPARDGKSAAQQRRRVRRFRILPQLHSQSPPVLRPRRPGRHGRAQQQQWDKGLPCPSQRRSDLAAEHWWGMLELAWRAKLAQSERSSDYLPARSRS